MKVETLIVGQLNTNCYLVFDEDSRQTFIIDPGDDGDYIIRKIHDLDLKPQAILATHAHFDHILAATELKLALKIPFYLHKNDLPILKRTQSTAKYFTGLSADPPIFPDKFLKDSQILKLEDLSFRVIETPGHTQGSVTFFVCDRIEKMLCIFVGDLLFAGGSHGRTDLEGGNYQKLKNSIKKILSFPPKTIIYPGHGKATTVEKERKFYQK